MARPTKQPAKMLQKFATRIRAELDPLVEQYDVRLADRPGYSRLPIAMRRDLERQLLNLIADALVQGDSRELVEHVRQRAVQWEAAGLEMAWFQASLTVPEEILVPLIDSVEASTFLWQALTRSHDTVWQIVAERTHKAEQTLRQSQQLLQTVMDNIPQAVFWKDQNLAYLGCNRAFAEDAGLASPAEIVGKTDYDMPWQTQAELYRTDDRLVIENGTAKINYEEPQTTPTGEQTWLRTSKVPMHDAAGKVTAVLGMYEDITARKEAESALARERNLLRTLIDNVPDQIFFKDAAGRIMLYNQADARAMGITSTEEAVGKTVYDLYPRELADLYNADDMAVIHSDQPLLNREEPGIDQAGHTRWILTTKIPLKDAQGNRLGLVGVARDVTERRNFELSLQQGEERFRRLSEATSEGLVFHDKGVILDANPAVIALFGFTAAAEMIGRNILEVIVPECHPSVMQKMQLEDVHPYEIECIRQDGSIFPVETATRTYQYEGRTVRASSIRDITRRKQLEQTIRESYERRGRQVEVSRQVAQEIATATDVDDIFPLVVKLIKERFDYYHAQIFRYDPVQDAVVLVVGYGEAGQQMLTAGHRLELGRGVVGTAAKSGQSLLAADSSADEDWRPNPYLPNTKGEVAVPIKFQDEILGILDVQSDRVNALTQDDVLLLEGLAGQIAVAIASTRTLEEAHTFQALVEAAGQGIAFAGPDGRLTYVNAAVARMFGLPRVESIIGRQITDFYPASEHARVHESAVTAIEHGQWTGELNIQPADRSALLSTINNVFTIKDRKGDLRYIANIITDISERKLAEQRLAEAIRLAKIGYWSYEVPTDTFTFNDQFYALMHTTAEREGGYALSSGQYTQRFVHPDDAPLVGIEIGKALETTDPNYRGEVSHRVYFGDGEPGYVAVRFTIEKDAQGRTIRTQGANQDITEIRLAEEELRTSETHLSQALQIAKLAYWEYDVEHDLFHFNDQFYSLFHTTAEQHGGYRVSSAYYAQHFVHPDDLPIVGAEIEKALNSTDRHYSRLLEHRVLYADGGTGHITVSINIDRDEQGKILRYYGANQDITERKLAEAELKETEERFRIIAETTPVPILISALADGSVLYGNEQLGQMFGLPIRDLIGRPTPDFYFDPVDRQALLTQLRQQGVLRDYELHVKRADGQPFWVLVSMRTLTFAGQRALFAAFIDITASRQAAEDLRRSEAQLSEALRTARLAYWELDLARQKFIFNDQLYALLHTTAQAEGGYEMDINAYVGRFIYPEDIPYVGSTIAQGLQNPDPNTSTQLETRVICADGEVRWLATQVSNKVNEAGQPIKAVGTNQDITERKLAEEAIRRSEAELSQALKIAKLAYWEYDVEHDLFHFNDQFYSLFHATAEQHDGYHVSSAYYAQHFVYPDDLPVVGAEIEKALNSTDRHYSRLLEHRILYADGGIGHISVNINIDRDEQGKILRYYGANQDITERKLAEEALRYSQSQLADALRIAQLANWSYDVPTDTFTFNDQFYALMRTTAAREGGYTLSSAQYTQRFVHPDDAPLVGTEIVKALETTDPNYRVEITHRVYFGDGELGYVTVRFTIEQDEHGRTIRTSGANQDVTANKRAELEREQLLQDVQLRANQIEAVSEVGAASAELLEPQALLESIVRLTRRRFNLYHCHIYLLDEVNRTLKVQACGWRNDEDQNQPAGDRVIQFDAAKSLVARAARTRQPVIVNDVHAEPGWLPNPQLPDVQSEMALPMVVGDKVLGVFNVHADERDHFTDEDAQAMTTLATQTAIALQNARLFEQTQRTAEELDLLNRRLTGEAWEAYLHHKTREHVILAKSDSPAAPVPLPLLSEPLAAGQVVVDQVSDQPSQTITTPIVLRGQTVGALRVQAGSGDWNEDMQSVLTSIASHIAQAAENTRLLEESEIRFARERALAEATDKIRRKLEVEHVLQTAAEELAHYLQASAINVQIGSSVTTTGQTGLPG